MHARVRTPALGRPLLLLVASVLALQGLMVFLREFPGPSKPVPKDFAQYYIAARVLMEREPDALYFTDIMTGLTTRRFPGSRFAAIGAGAGIEDTSYYIYPPWVGLLYVPVAGLSPYRALVVVYLVNWILALAALFLLARSLPGWGWPAAAGSFALLIHTTPFLQAIRAGQASVPVLLLIVLFAHALWRRRDIQAGLWLAFVTGMKLFPILFVPYLLVMRRWRALAAFALGGALLLGVSLAAAGWEAHLRYLHLMLDYVKLSTTLSSNQSVTGLILRWMDATSPRHWSVLPIPTATAWAARAVLLAWMAVTLVLADRLRRRGGEWGEPLALALATVWVFSGASNVWLHHLVGLALPFAVAAAWLGARSGAPVGGFLVWTASWGGLFLFDAYYRVGGGGHGRVFNLLVSLPLFGAVLLYLLLARLAVTEASSPADTAAG